MILLTTKELIQKQFIEEYEKKNIPVLQSKNYVPILLLLEQLFIHIIKI